MPSSDDVLVFWFPAGVDRDDETAHRARFAVWFGGGDAMDQAIASRFRDTWERAVRGELDAWAATPRGRLALVIVLDQFSRNLARGKPAAYAQDARAQALAREAMESPQLVDGFAIWELQFLAVALGHSEDPALHELGISWFERMIAERTPPHLADLYRRSLGQAQGHRDVIARFGRHPQRNAVLGRTSTPEELAYLAGTPVHLRRV